jgi:acetyl esterase/lipase
VSTEQKENLDAILRQSAFPAGVTVTAAALGGIPTAEITVDGIEPRHVVMYFHGGVYVLEDASQVAGLAAQVGRRARAKVISVDYRLSRELLQPRVTDYTAEHDPATGLISPFSPTCPACRP